MVFQEVNYLQMLLLCTILKRFRKENYCELVLLRLKVFQNDVYSINRKALEFQLNKNSLAK